MTPAPTFRPISLLATLAFLTAAGWFYAWTPASFTERWLTPQATGLYHELTGGLLAGQLSLALTPDPRLVALPDPYDPVTNAPYRVNDVSYYAGRYYLYLSPVPALVLFAPVRLLTGAYLSETAACVGFALAGLAAATAFLLTLRRHFFPTSPGLLVACGLAALAFAQGYQVVLRADSPQLVPIACAHFWLMLAMLAMLRAILAEKRAWAWLLAASLCYGLAIASRPNYLFGGLTLLVPLLVWWRGHGWQWTRSFAGHLAAAGLPAAGLIGALLLYNAARFGNPLEFGMSYQLGAWDQRHMPGLGFTNVLENAYYYLLNPGRYAATFPFVSPVSWQATGVLLHVPFVLLVLCFPLAAAPAPSARPVLWLLLVSWMANLCFLLLFPSGNAEAVLTSANARYLFDFQPAWVLLAAGCLIGAGATVAGRPLARHGLTGLALLLALLSVAAGVSLDFQRFPPEAYRPLARLLNRPAWWWERSHGIAYGPVELEVQLPTDRNGAYEPLLATGTPASGDLVYVFYESPGQIRIGLVGSETPGPLSPAIALDYARPHRLEFHLGSLYPAVSHPAMAAYGEAQVAALKRRLVVKLDGNPVLEAPIFFHAGPPGRVQAGATDFLLAYSGPKFSGKILAERRLPFPAPVANPGRPDYGPVRLSLQFPTGRDRRVEPLVVSGVPQAGDLVSVEYQGERAVRFVTDHWGHRSVSSEWIPVDFSAAHAVDISLGSLLPPGRAFDRDRLRIVLDGRTVLDVVQPAYDSSPYDVAVGRNVIGSSTAAYSFSGFIHEITRLPLPPATPPSL